MSPAKPIMAKYWATLDRSIKELLIDNGDEQLFLNQPWANHRNKKESLNRIEGWMTGSQDVATQVE